MLTIYELKNDAIGELSSRLHSEDVYDHDHYNDIIHEVTENWIPVYTREILELAMSKFDLVSINPDC